MRFSAVLCDQGSVESFASKRFSGVFHFINFSYGFTSVPGCVSAVAHLCKKRCGLRITPNVKYKEALQSLSHFPMTKKHVRYNRAFQACTLLQMILFVSQETSSVYLFHIVPISKLLYVLFST